VIIGAAFGKIVESIVGDLFMPVLGAIGGFDFTNYFLPLSKAVTATNLVDAQKQGAVIAYGRFITIAINFMIIAAVMFMVVKGMNRLKRQEAVAPVEAKPTAEVVLLTEIRDLMKK